MEEEIQSTLRSAPSFEIYNNSHHHHHDEDHHYNNNNDPEQVLKRTLLSLETIGSDDEFTFERDKMDLIKDAQNEIQNDWSTEIQNLSIDDDDDDGDVQQPSTPPMYLATGLGVDGAEVVSDNNNDMLFVPNLQESEDLDEYYKGMVHEYPSHPLILKKYAHFLQGKGELRDAEEYFQRATEADPNNGEILMHYAKLVWENHHDRDRASVYFERAAQASPQDSDVLAAYVSFLWETEDDENEEGNRQTQNNMKKQETEPVKTSKEENDVENLTTANLNEDINDVDYLKKMIDENPKNPVFLKNQREILKQQRVTTQEQSQPIPKTVKPYQNMLNYIGNFIMIRKKHCLCLNKQFRLPLKIAMFLQHIHAFFGRQKTMKAEFKSRARFNRSSARKCHDTT